MLWKVTRNSATADGVQLRFEPRPFCIWVQHTNHSTMSVKMLSTVETSCTTNHQQIIVMKLEDYSWLTCSKQQRLVDCHIGVVNKLNCWQWRRVLLTMWSTCRGKIFWVRSLEQSPREKYPNFRRYWNYFITAWHKWKEAGFSESFRYHTGLWQTDTRRQQIPR